jgi:hypothetical protein
MNYAFLAFVLNPESETRLDLARSTRFPATGMVASLDGLWFW